MKKIFKITLYFVCIILVFFVVNLNLKQCYKPNYQEDMLDRLRFLKTSIHKGSASEMQDIYPEGFFFMNVIYGLTWIDVLKKEKYGSAIFNEGMGEINFAQKELDSDKGRAVFQEDLTLKYGVYYQGWKNLLLAKKIELSLKHQPNKEEIAVFEARCDEIAKGFQESNTPFLESYPNGKWPADNVIAMASLAIHDKILPEKYTDLKASWLAKVKNQLDHQTGLIAHEADSNFKGARGSSASLMLCFLPEIDSVFAKEQFFKFRTHFLDTRLGLTAIREFPKGIAGNGDIDSGPVIWDVGGVASIVGIRVFAVNKDFENAIAIRNNIEGLTFATNFGSKKYFFGQLPMVDVFLAWSNALELPESSKNSNHSVVFMFYSLVFFGICFHIFKFLQTKNPH
jgi:hypothetical protein